jgi:hypothetical protein
VDGRLPSTTIVGSPARTRNTLVPAAGLVVLGDRLARRELDRVEAERLDSERATHQHPLAVGALELVVVPDRERFHAASSLDRVILPRSLDVWPAAGVDRIAVR